MGTLSILNVYEGHVKISYDTKNAAEAIRARRIITDMLRRGYALLIEVEHDVYQRAVDFDDKVGEYIIADFDPSNKNRLDQQGESDDGQKQEGEEETPPKIRSTRGRPARSRIPMEKANAVAVARSAGG